MLATPDLSYSQQSEMCVVYYYVLSPSRLCSLRFLQVEF